MTPESPIATASRRTSFFEGSGEAATTPRPNHHSVVEEGNRARKPSGKEGGGERGLGGERIRGSIRTSGVDVDVDDAGVDVDVAEMERKESLRGRRR